MTIAGLTGVAPADAGVASGLINTTRQIGGAVGLAAVSTIAAASVHHGVSASVAGADLTHGFRTAFDILTGLTLVGVAIAVRYMAPTRRPADRAVDRHEHHRAPRGGSMITELNHHVDGEQLLAHEIDDLLLQARGLVLVRDLLAERGASRTEIDAHTDELARVRARLAATIAGAEEPHFLDAA